MTTVFRFNYPKILLFTILLLAASILAVSTFAQDATTGATRRENVKQRVDTRKERVAERIDTRKERVASKEAALKDRLATFKDKKKAQIAEKVNTNLNRINQNQTDSMSKHLSKMSSILTRLETKVNDSSPDVKDTEAAQAEIEEAKAAIASASAAVTAQAEKDYTIQVTSEGRIKQDAKKQREALHSDLKAVRQLVIDAKQAVANAIRIAKSGKLDPGKEATNSGQ